MIKLTGSLQRRNGVSAGNAGNGELPEVFYGEAGATLPRVVKMAMAGRVGRHQRGGRGQARECCKPPGISLSQTTFL